MHGHSTSKLAHGSHSPLKDVRMLLGTRFATTRPLQRPLYHLGQRRSRRFNISLRTLSTFKGRRQRAAPVFGQMPTSAFVVQAGLKKPQNPGDMFNLCAPFSKRIKMVKLVLTPQPALNTKNESAGSHLAVGYISPAFTTKRLKPFCLPLSHWSKHGRRPWPLSQWIKRDSTIFRTD